MEDYVQLIIGNGIEIMPSELYCMTLSEISSVVDGHNQRVRLQKMFFGTLTASIYNTAHKKASRMLRWFDIYPDTHKSKSAVRTSNHPMTNEEIKQKLVSAFGGVR